MVVSCGEFEPMRHDWYVLLAVVMALKRPSYSFSILISKASDIRHRHISPYNFPFSHSLLPSLITFVACSMVFPRFVPVLPFKFVLKLENEKTSILSLNYKSENTKKNEATKKGGLQFCLEKFFEFKLIDSLLFL